jgi:hypothetical protein
MPNADKEIKGKLLARINKKTPVNANARLRLRES